MYIFRRDKKSKSSKAEHTDKCHGDAKRRPNESKALPVGHLAEQRNKQHRKMNADNSDSLGKRLANGEGCIVSLMFMGISSGIMGTIVYNIIQYLS